MYMKEFYPELHVCICQQADKKVWNKGLLYNAGYNIMSAGYDYVILHDIDFLPVVGKVDYSSTDAPCMIAGEASQFGYRLMFPTFFGGVVTCSKEHYELVNGFSNQFKGYGGEDCNFRDSFIQKGIQTGTKAGRFECFAHPKPDITPGSQFFNSPEYQHNWKLVHQPRDFSEGLSNCMDLIESYHIDISPNYTHIKLVTKCTQIT
jgi:N-terminal domain of galactosyltransferase/N-terminal region of glycosyl transferase group 7